MARQYNRQYQMTHDIDWFFQDHGYYFHVASNGGQIPSKIKSMSNYAIQTKVYEMKEVYDVVVEEDAIKKYVLGVQRQDYEGLENIKNNPLENYLISFRSMAEKGFVSLDTIIAEDDSQKYILVAYPQKLKEVGSNELSQMKIPEISGLLEKIINRSALEA